MFLNIIIVGGVAGGASAAAKARRTNETANIEMFEKGPYVSFANFGLPYYVGKTIPDRDDLLLQTRSGIGNDSWSRSTCYTKSFT